MTQYKTRIAFVIHELKLVLSGAVISAVVGAVPSHGQAMTAGVVLDKLSAEERNAYLAGVIEGLAYARYAKDGKQTDGMACIYQWFYQTDGTRRAIHEAFGKYADYTPGAVLAAMTEKECGR